MTDGTEHHEGLDMSKRSVLHFFVIFLLSGIDLWACRFNVRDVGFVDLDKNPYQLLCFMEGLPEGDQKTLQDLVLASLFESHIQAQFLAGTVEEASHPALAENPWQPEGYPAAVLISSNNAIFPFPLPPMPIDKDHLWTALQRLVHSPLRDALAKDIVDAYAMILLLEGRDEAENRLMAAAAQGAVEEIEGQMDLLPKPIKKPPQILTLPHAKREEEKILQWALGIEPGDTASAVVVYGRARLMGPVMRGETLSQAQMHNRLALIGLSCECGLDRSWMQGTMIPMPWDEALLARVADNLGFDTENPMVKMEISQILSIGGVGLNRTASPSSTGAFMGYTEINLSEEQPRAELPNAAILAQQASSAIDDAAMQENESRASRVRITMVLTLFFLGVPVIAIGVFIVIRARRMS